jgi:ubiquinone biosynthesis protein
MTAEGVAYQLYPDLNVVEEIEPYARKLAEERWNPLVIWRGVRRGLTHFLTLQKQLPLRLCRITNKIQHGNLQIRFQHENLEGFRNSLENVSNRLTLGVIIGSMIIGSSMIITTGIEPHLFGFPVLGIIGYLISGILGLWLVINILRSRKF